MESKMDFKNKSMELFVGDLIVDEDVDTGILVVGGYANRYKDDSGEIVVDRSGESVLPSGYDLKSFMKNPILLYQHRKDEPLGKIISLELRTDGFYVEAEVHKVLHEKAYYAIQQEILTMFSIGFLVKDYFEKEGVYYWSEIEILEVSAVSIGDNQESLFNVLVDSPCNNGKCVLAAKSLQAVNSKEELKENHKEWSKVDKSALLAAIEANGVEGIPEEAYLIVKDPKDSSTWKFPHHGFVDMEGLSLLKGGLISAFSGLKGAKDDETHSLQNKYDASLHLIKHFTELLEEGSVDNIPEDLIELSKYFEEKLMAIEKDVEQPAEQPADVPPINTPEQPEDGNNNPQNPDPVIEDGASDEPDGNNVTSIEDVTLFIEEASKSSEGLNTLLIMYADLEASINEALPKLLEEEN